MVPACTFPLKIMEKLKYLYEYIFITNGGKMPRGDRTGPYGCGCGCGHGMRREYERGSGWRYHNPVALTKEEEKKILEAELKEIDSEKQQIEERLKGMK
jgi:hypothetical protein